MLPTTPTRADDERFMRMAMVQADLAIATGDVPIGAIVVDQAGVVIGAGRNRREADHDPTAHAEIVAVREAAMARRDWRLAGATVYVTVEPCPMCAGALLSARVTRIVYGCADGKAGALGSVVALGTDSSFNHRFVILAGILAEESAARLKLFFALLRADGEK